MIRRQHYRFPIFTMDLRVRLLLRPGLARPSHLVPECENNSPGADPSTSHMILRRLGKLRYRSGSYPGIFTHSRAFVRQKSTA
jgi:hypothetical protein